MSVAAALLELCEQERAAVAAGDIAALGTIALARIELTRKLAASAASGGAGDGAVLRRLKAEVERNLGLYEELLKVTAGYRRWLLGRAGQAHSCEELA